MRRLLVGASLVYAVAIVLFALSSFSALSIILLAAVGSMQMTYRVLARAIIQEECPSHLLGRAMSLFFLDRGFGSLGAICIGSVAALIPVPLAVAGSAVACALVSWLLPRAASAPANPDYSPGGREKRAIPQRRRWLCALRLTDGRRQPTARCGCALTPIASPRSPIC